MECDMCGRKIDSFVLGVVEGVDMRLCERCSSHSKTIRKPIQQEIITKNLSKVQDSSITSQEVEESVIKDFAKIIRKEREKRKMEQEKFAKFISEKISILQKIESGSFVPQIETVKRIGRKLGINLVKKESSESYSKGDYSPSKQGLTLGDLIKKK